MAPRANWKGFLKIAEVACPVALYTAASASDRMVFHTLNRATGHRVHRVFIDGETGKTVPREEQVKGYETAPGDYVVLEPEEVTSAVPDSDKTLAVDAFIPCREIDHVYFDNPYYLAPANGEAEEVYAVIRDGMSARKVAALARTVLFRRVRTVLIRAHGPGLIATTLNFDYEVRPAEEVFDEVPDLTIEGEMLDLAKHIIRTKSGTFDPSQFEDRYEEALADLVKAKIAGKPVPIRKAPAREKVVDLMAVLRESAGLTKAKSARRSSARPKTVRKTTARKAN
ncbi:Ku protein [Labrys sp. KNU-23]|uniref:non-homologous end joining protein Ku n=1 Tax=Labrys sp. KNU-23 TaxID=2789216 RepID=UPI0011EEA229|nr:Ku protein [Labrys sp. KNU-23]QEN85288.1 Ku protein [Labrys sp. KNU-23]